MEPPDPMQRFGTLLTQYQSRMYAYIFSCVGDPDVALEVFQESNLVLWRKASEFDQTREFLPWALAIARNQIRAARTKAGRDRLLFDEGTVERLATAAAERATRMDDRQVALAHCLERLPDEHRAIVQRRYRDEEELQQIAQTLGRTSNSLGVTLFRIRKTLADCIQGRLEASS